MGIVRFCPFRLLVWGSGERFRSLGITFPENWSVVLFPWDQCPKDWSGVLWFRPFGLFVRETGEWICSLGLMSPVNWSVVHSLALNVPRIGVYNTIGKYVLLDLPVWGNCSFK